MADLEIDVSELNKLAVDVAKTAVLGPAEARKVLQKSASDIKADAQAFCPVDTGNLRSSITYETRQLVGGAAAEIGPTASYGGYVEFGTSRMAPYAYMGPAFDRRVPEFLAALEAIADKALD